MTKAPTVPEGDYLRKVSVRLIGSEERARFDALLEARHYLHSARVGGQSLRHVAEVEGQWVALLVFSGAARHTKAREAKLGWTPRQRTRRLGWVVNNSRFFRVITGLDAAEFDLRQWMMAQEISILQALAIDGKCLRGRARTDGKPLQLLSAVSHRLRLTVAQEPIEQKSNEIPSLQPLLRKLAPRAVEGSLITADALHCQQKSAQFVTQELGADYLWGLKGNQDGILERAQVRLSQRFFSP